MAMMGTQIVEGLLVFLAVINIVSIVWILWTLQRSWKGKPLRKIDVVPPVVIACSLSLFFGILPQRVESFVNRVVQREKLPEISKIADILHHSLPIIADMHSDSLLWNRDLLQRSSQGHVDIPRLLESNVGLQGFGIVTKVPLAMNFDSNKNNTDAITLLTFAQNVESIGWSLMDRALHQCAVLHQTAERSGGAFRVIHSKEELQKYVEYRNKLSIPKNVTAGFLGVEGAHPVKTLEDVDTLFKAGVRLMAPVHFFDNQLGGSAHGEEKGGLTQFGKDVVKRMQEIGMIVDLAHCSPHVVDDVLEITTQPVAVSHTGVKGTCDSPRNLSDKHLKRIADTGGIVGIGFFYPAVCKVDGAEIARTIKYVVDLIGIEHVVLGSDFDGAVVTAFTVLGLNELTQSLIDEGFSQDQIAKIMGENQVNFFLKNLPSL